MRLVLHAQHRQQPLLSSDEPGGVGLHEIVAGPRVGCIEHAIPQRVAVCIRVCEPPSRAREGSAEAQESVLRSQWIGGSRRPIGIGVRPHRSCRGVQPPVDPIRAVRQDPCHTIKVMPLSAVLVLAEHRRSRRVAAASHRTTWCGRASSSLLRVHTDAWSVSRLSPARGTASSSTSQRAKIAPHDGLFRMTDKLFMRNSSSP